MCGPARTTCSTGRISQWLQTISIVFSVMLLIPVWAVVYNFIATMKGQWHQLSDNVSLKFLMTGTIFYLLTCFQGPMHSLRSVNAIVSKTDWIPGHAHMAVLGTFSFIAMAGVYHVIPRIFKTTLHSEAVANWSFWLFLIGGLGHVHRAVAGRRSGKACSGTIPPFRSSTRWWR